MRIYALVLLFCFFTGELFCQPANLVQGENFISTARLDEDIVIGHDSNAVYLITDINPEKSRTSSFNLCKFSLHDGKNIFSKNFAFPEGTQAIVLAAVLINDKIVFHVEQEFGGGKKTLLRYTCFRTNCAEVNAPFPEASSETEFQGDNETGFAVQYSPDLTKRMILKEVMANTNREIKTVKMFDTKTGQLLWEQVLNQGSEFSVPAMGTEVQDGFNSVVDNSGRFCYMYYTNNEESGIQIIAEKFSSNRSLIIPTQSVTVMNPYLEVVNGDLICSGEILEGARKYKIYQDKEVKMGFFLMQIDAGKGEIRKFSQAWFNDDLVRKLSYPDKNPHYSYEGVKSIYYNNKSYRHYKTLFFNGAMYLVKYHGFDWITEGDFSPAHFVAGKEIIVMKFRDFDLQWMRILPRNTLVHDRGGKNDATGLAFSTVKKLHFFYFDRAANLSKFPDPLNYTPGKYKRSKNSSSPVVHLSVDVDGKIQREKFFTGKGIYVYGNDKHPELKNDEWIMMGSQVKKARKMIFFKMRE